MFHSLSENAVLPSRGSAFAAGYDLASAVSVVVSEILSSRLGMAAVVMEMDS